MNNSKIALDFVTLSEDLKPSLEPSLKERESKVVRILEAIRELSDSGSWLVLKAEVFDDMTLSLEKAIKSEAEKENPDTNLLNRITGQLMWARRYSDLSKLESVFRVELKGLRQKLYGKA